MIEGNAPYHAHIYFEDRERDAALALHRELTRLPEHVLFIGNLINGKAGPHPIPQFEVHFLKRSLGNITDLIRASELRALVHPLTDDDLADHTRLARWIGKPVELDLSTLDPSGMNQGVARFGKSAV
jgi:aromatic ring-cleaving dioxygenase